MRPAPLLRHATRPAAAVPLPPTEIGGRARAVISRVEPSVDGGRHAVKRTIGEALEVRALAFSDGHDLVACRLRHRPPGAAAWVEVPMSPLPVAVSGTDWYHASFVPAAVGRHLYTVVAAVDRWGTWARGTRRKLDAGQEVGVDLLVGAGLAEDAAVRARGAGDPVAVDTLVAAAERLRAGDPADALATAAPLAELLWRYDDPDLRSVGPLRRVHVERVLARFGSWYELFPRSLGEDGRHGTLRDVEGQLDRMVRMGIDVLYLPPIHPIGRVNRKGRNNALRAQPGDLGSPWAIGSDEGGHLAVHPELGTLEDLRALVAAAREREIEIALDIAFQCAPDHPWVSEHPEWFRHRPDGSIQYAENPPKRYEDIVPFDFETTHWRELWQALLGIFLHWCEQGVRVFRVDNPHTKPFALWEWLLATVRDAYPDTIFLAEAFTRPPVLHELAKLGFDQSYNYFPWRTTKWELETYLTELSSAPGADYLRPNLWPNTPDILTETLQHGGRAAFVIRLVLAATMGASYGIYGPAFELGEHVAREPGSEEYLDSEKYQQRTWALGDPGSLEPMVATLNRIRRTHRALQDIRGIRFHRTDNDHVISYSKRADGPEALGPVAATSGSVGVGTHRADAGQSGAAESSVAVPGDAVVLVVVNLDPHHRHRATVELDLDALGVDRERPFQVHDLLGGARYVWQGRHAVVDLDPALVPAHVFAVRHHLRREHDFDYFA